MMRLLRNLTFLALTATLLSSSVLPTPVSTQSAVFLPLVHGQATAPALLHAPVAFLIDSPFLAYDTAGVEFLAVQGVIGSKHAKVAVVYQVQADGSLREVLRDVAIYGAPKLLARPDGVGIVYGADRDGTIHIDVVPGWTP